MSAGTRTIYRFAVYEVDVEAGELRKSGVRIRLPEQALRVLTALLERPGEMVSREEMKRRLWPQDTFVDFDHSLNTVINKLREALGDSASSPRYIETLARRGYRFLQPVEAQDRLGVPRAPETSAASTGISEKLSPALESSGRANSLPSILTQSEDLPHIHGYYARTLFLLIQIMYLVFYIVALGRQPQLDTAVEQAFGHHPWIVALVLVSALVAVPVRLYLISGTVFGVRNFSQKFRRMFIPIVLADELWALAPLLLSARIGTGLALAATAALIYVPFAERSLLLMADRSQYR